MAKLDRVVEIFRQPGEEPPKDVLGVGGECSGELQHDRANSFAERSDAAKEVSGLSVDILQLFLMSDRLGELERESKARRSLFSPTFYGLFARQTIESRVPLDGIEDGAILLEMFAGFGPGTIETSHPGSEAPKRTSQMEAREILWNSGL